MNAALPDEVGRVSAEIGVLQQDLGSILSELDRRRRELLDVRLQLRRHPMVAVAAAGAAALLVGGLVASARRERRRPGPPAGASLAVTIATAAGVAAGSALARTVARRLLARARAVPPRPVHAR